MQSITGDLNAMDTKENIFKMNLFELAVFILLIGQMLFIIYTNLFCIPNTVDNDSAKLFIHAIEMWNNKTLFLHNWANMTTLEIDCSAILAMPLYSITHNIYTAFGLANIAFVTFYIYIFSGIMKKTDASRLIRMFTYLLLLIPYSFGQLLYYNMMFFSGGQYVVKALIPILLIWLLCNLNDEKNLLNWIIIAALCAFFTFTSAISSGMYVFMSAIIPIGVCYIVFHMPKKNLKEVFLSRGSIYLAFEFFLSVIGIYISIRKQVNTRGNDISLITIEQLIASFGKRISSIYELLGGLRSNDVYKVISIEGITCLLKFSFSTALLITIIYYTVKMIKIIANQKEFSAKESVISYILVLFWCNFIILLLTDSSGTARYHIMSVVPAFPLLVLGCEKVYNWIKDKNQKLVFNFCVLAILIGIVVGSDYQVLNNDSVPEMNSLVVKANQLLEFVDEYPENHVFVLNDTGLPEMFRLLAYSNSKEYMGYIAETNTIEVHDYYYSDEYYEWLENPFILIICDSNSSIDDLADDMKKRSTRLGHVQNYSVYHIK